MHIGIDAQSAQGDRTGIGQYTAELLNALRDVAPENIYEELSWRRDLSMRTDRRLRWQQLELPRRARVSGVQLLHVTGFDAPRWKPCPVVLTVNDLIGVLFPRNLPIVSRLYWGRWLPHSVKWADRIIVISEHTKRDLLRLVDIPPERVTVTYLGVEGRFQPVRDPGRLEEIRCSYGLPAKFLLYVGTLEPRKGLDVLIRAFATLVPYLQHSIVIVGKKGWYTDTLFNLVKTLGLGNRVLFLNYVPRDHLPALYTLADLFVFPSRYEGFGLPPLEAMACGTPVVCTDVSSLPEVVGNSAQLVPPDKPEALARAISDLLTAPSRRAEMRVRGFDQAAQFTWKRTARETLTVYRELLCESV